jgi:hypothetical protein
MAKLTRVNQKLFGANGPSGDFGQFGSLAAGAANYTKDPTTIQSLAAFLTGWAAATLANNRPALEDMNSLFHLVYYQLCYILQQGIAEWDTATTYYTGSLVNYGGIIYKSLQDDNLAQTPSSSPVYWAEAFLDLTRAQTITGIKTFTAAPILPTPTTDYQGATKKYVDDNKTTNASLLTSGTLPAARLNTYDSGWFAVSAPNSYIKTHGLGTTKVLADIWVAENADGSGWCFNSHRVWISTTTNGAGMYVSALAANTITIQAGHGSSLSYVAAGINNEMYASGYCRVIMLALA